MASTGEIAAFGTDIHEAYWGAFLSQNGFKIPKAGSGVLIGGDITKPEMRSVAKVRRASWSFLQSPLHGANLTPPSLAAVTRRACTTWASSSSAPRPRSSSS